MKKDNIYRSLMNFFLLFLLTSTIFGGIRDKKENSGQYVSFWGGIYSEKPLLNAIKIKNLMHKNEQINSELKLLGSQIQQLKRNVPDTITVRKHLTFLGGKFTIPRLTDQEKQIIKSRAEMNTILQKIEKRKREIDRIQYLLEQHHKYNQRSLLWNFVTWHVKKETRK